VSGEVCQRFNSLSKILKLTTVLVTFLTQFKAVRKSVQKMCRFKFGDRLNMFRQMLPRLLRPALHCTHVVVGAKIRQTAADRFLSVISFALSGAAAAAALTQIRRLLGAAWSYVTDRSQRANSQLRSNVQLR